MAYKLPEKSGILICGHGSRNKIAVEQFRVLAEKLQVRLTPNPVKFGYLEFAKPVLKTALDELYDQGVRDILAVPAMLFAAGHAKNDIPSVLNMYQAQKEGLRVRYGRELGVDPKMMAVAAKRIKQGLGKAADEDVSDTLLMVVGRGASDPDANSNIHKVMRLLWEGMGFGWGEVSYSGVSFPLVPPGLEHAAKLGYRRIIVFPYFLFTGVLINRIYKAVDAAAASYPEIEFIKAPFLGDHDLVVDTLIERLEEIDQGENLMNCQMCQYRTQILGFEAHVGQEQHSHHHHVEGVGEGLENCPCKGDCDARCRDEAFCQEYGLVFTPLHTHHHAPYPRADHPLGPKSMRK